MIVGFGQFGEDAAPVVPAGYVPVAQCDVRATTPAEIAKALVDIKNWPRLWGPGLVAGLIIGWVVFK